MADTARPHGARDGGKFTRCGCAGAPRNRGFGCLRTDERCSFIGLLRPNFHVSRDCSEPIAVRLFPQRLEANAVRQELRILQILVGVICIKMSADFTCQLEIVSEVPGEFVRFSSYGWLPRTPSLLRTAARFARCSGVSVMSTCAVPSTRDVPARQLLDLVGVLAKSTTVLAKFRSSRLLEEEFRMDPGDRIKKTGLRTGPEPSPSSSLRDGSVRRLGTLYLWDPHPRTGESNCCIVQLRSKDILDRNSRFLREDETSETSTGSKNSSITVSMNWVALLRAISSKLLCIRDPRTGTSRHSHLRLETLCASGAVLWCCSRRSPDCIP